MTRTTLNALNIFKQGSFVPARLTLLSNGWRSQFRLQILYKGIKNQMNSASERLPAEVISIRQIDDLHIRANLCAAFWSAAKSEEKTGRVADF